MPRFEQPEGPHFLHILVVDTLPLGDYALALSRAMTLVVFVLK